MQISTQWNKPRVKILPTTETQKVHRAQRHFHATSFLQKTTEEFCFLHFSKVFGWVFLKNLKTPWGKNFPTEEYVLNSGKNS